MGVFEKNKGFKDIAYPEVLKYKRSIQHAFWLHTEWSFSSDVQDYFTKLNNSEQNAIKNTLLAISTIEVSVKRFWARLGDRFPRTEFEQTGIVFADSEVRHADAYSHLLEVLGLNEEFEHLLENPVIQGRVDYLTKYIKGSPSSTNQNFTLNLALFALFIENASLTSQFVIIKSFLRAKKVLKDISNVVDATNKEEVIHALLGSHIVNIIKEENPEWFDEEFYGKIIKATKKAFDAECRVIDWIFGAGELDFLPKDVLKEFIKDRFNQSLGLIQAPPVFEVDQELVKQLDWFNVEQHAETQVDFFARKSVAYSKGMQSYDEESLFE